MRLKPHADRHISLHVWSVYNLQEINASDWWLVPDFDKTNNTLYEAITSLFPLDELHKRHHVLSNSSNLQGMPLAIISFQTPALISSIWECSSDYFLKFF
jgi:hypothetical protein